MSTEVCDRSSQVMDKKCVESQVNAEGGRDKLNMDTADGTDVRSLHNGVLAH